MKGMPMIDRRQTFRGRVYYGGRIAFNARQSTIDCIVRNFSAAGAKVEFTNTAVLPEEIDLSIERKGVAFVANMIWRRQNEAGVVFRNQTHTAQTIPLDWALRLRAQARANKALRRQVDELRCSY
jgi:hypothetical protein